ncbi:MAG: glycosyltransferase [Planctomycetes bacterium]|nr:glycosyltransferase [Planctomycetota bacterium]
MTAPRYPRISVVTPAFKGERLIEVTLRSVLDQEYPNLEYIVLDGAGDNTDQILKRYDSQLAYWHSRPDDGQYAAINEGFAKSTGEILCWLNADDLLLPRSLFVVAGIFAKLSHVKWISTLKPGSWDANSFLSHVGNIPGFSKAAFLDGLFLPGTNTKGYWIQQESTFFTRELWEQAGARIPDYHLAGDFALWCEFYKHAELYGVDYPLAGFRHVEGQRSEAMDKYMSEAGNALSSFRQRCQWKRPCLNALRYTCYDSLPRGKNFVRNRLGYLAKRVVNLTPNKFAPTWDIHEYRFLP